MESRVGKYSDDGGAEISRKIRSLDSVLKEGNKVRCSVENGKEGKKKKRKGRKEAALSSIEPTRKKSKKSSDEVYVGGVTLGSGDLGNSLSGLSERSSTGSRLKGIFLGLNGNGTVLQIPKRPRGSVGRKKFLRNQASKPSGLSGSNDHNGKLSGDAKKSVGSPVAKPSGSSNSKTSSVDQTVELNRDSGGEIVVNLKVSQKLDVEDCEGSRICRVSSARLAEEEDGHVVVNNGDASSGKRLRKHRKRKGLALGHGTVAKKVEPALVNSASNCDDLQDDEDEENLEANAARMLSARFDPSCTQFSSKSKSFASRNGNELSFMFRYDQDFVCPGENSLAASESASNDSASRVLRPRNEHKEKALSRKRRHFYEVLSTDLDAHWVLNRRIKVFWPLDENWYYGLVNDYDPERKLHHIKYDDRDEEWIDLQNERFKLLLLRSEVPGKAEPKKSIMGDEGKRDLTSDDDSYEGSYMDSEPIISWLARSCRRVKSSPSRALKKQRTSHSYLNFIPPLPSDNIDDEHADLGFMKTDTKTVNGNSAFHVRSFDDRRDEKPVIESSTSSKYSKPPIVYCRRWCGNKDRGSITPSVNDNASGSVLGSVPSFAVGVDTFQTSKFNNVSLDCFNPDEFFWSIDDKGLLKLTMHLTAFEKFRFELCLSIPHVLEFAFRLADFWLIHSILPLQYGAIVSMWPKVQLEMLFVDNIVGLRFFLFEGCLKQAVAFVFLVLSIFHQPNEQGKFVDLQLPVTSIRFKLSCVQDFRKQCVFASYSFSKVKCSKWLYLDEKLQQHCFLTEKLPLSECTYDNIRALEGGGNQMDTNNFVGGKPSSFQGLRKKSVEGIMHMGIFKESCNVNERHISPNSDLKHGKLPPFALSFTAAPTFFVSLHLKLLMESSIACISFEDNKSAYSRDHSESTYLPISDDRTHVEDYCDNARESTPESDLQPSLTEAACSGWLPGAGLQFGTDAGLQLVTDAGPQLGIDAISASDDVDCAKSSENLQNRKQNFAESSACHTDPGNNAIDLTVKSQNGGCNDLGSKQIATSLLPVVSKDDTSPHLPNVRHYSSLNCISVEISSFDPSLDQIQRPVNERAHSTQQASDSEWNTSDGFVGTPNPTGARSLCHHNRNSSSSSSFGQLSHLLPDGNIDFICNGFGIGPKKPRTQVHYTVPFGGVDFSSRHRIDYQKRVPFKRIRRAHEKKTSNGSRGSLRNLDLLGCDANVLITLGDRGWRECGARVILELADQNEWKLSVQLSGTTKYSFKVHYVMQPGSTNRYTHAMMWKGGKDWVLEFPDRSQWMLFKEMHEECYNRNIRAASVKNIPIPGVRLIEENDDNVTEVPFVCSSSKYVRQVDTDVDMAMDASRILYDMDSDDEKWIFNSRKCSHSGESKCEDISEEFFEKIMDTFEKVSYAQQCDDFTSEEIEEFMVGFGPMEVIKIIYEHWRLKRERKGMPLIRQLQPPLWQRYQQLVKEWEQAMIKANIAISGGSQWKTQPIEKPPMFAFCLMPRGLEVSNKGSKHRSQRKFPVMGHNHAVLGDQDGLYAFGRRSNGFSLGDEKVVFPGNGYESSEASPVLQASTRAFSPRDAGGTRSFSLSNEGFEWNHHPKLYRNKSKKIGAFLSSNNQQMAASFNQRTIGKRNGFQQCNMASPEWPSQKYSPSEVSHRHGIELLDGPDLDEFRLRDASGAAQHARNMAKLKRESAQRALYRADLAIHKAVAALMTAEAIKASFEDLKGEVVCQDDI